MKVLTLAALVCLACVSPAQLTHQQKQDDFRQLVGMYDKHYAPYAWKRDAFGFDLLQMQPWFEQVNSSKDDLAFYDICLRYVASLNDSHDEFTLPSGYEAYVPITADIYDGRVLIDFIDRTALDVKTYPFAIGDEILALDGRTVADWIASLGVYSANGRGNPVSRDRIAVAAMLDRYQGWNTYASDIRAGDKAILLVKSQNGTTSTYAVPWVTIALPFTQQGRVPNPGGKPFSVKTAFSESPVKRPMREIGRATTNEWGIWTGEEAPHEATQVPRGMEKLESAQDFSALMPDHVVAGSLAPFSSKFPRFNPPPGFRLRLGARSTDEFVTGTFPAGNKLVGFIRSPSFSPASQTNALAQFRSEIQFLQQNTSGLVIDLLGNGGGSLCYTNSLVQYLSPQPFQTVSVKLRATEQWLLTLESLLVSLESKGGSQADIDITNEWIEQTQAALAQNRGDTDPIYLYSPVLCNGGGGLVYPPATLNGNNIAYTKPILLLTDSFTLSAAESFSAILQDIHRVSVYGTRTDGGGGNVVAYNYATGAYAEGSIRVTQSLEVRNHDITTPDLPPAPYIENIGIQPDFFADYQTKTNLLTGGRPFVTGFVNAIGSLIGN